MKNNITIVRCRGTDQDLADYLTALTVDQNAIIIAVNPINMNFNPVNTYQIIYKD